LERINDWVTGLIVSLKNPPRVDGTILVSEFDKQLFPFFTETPMITAESKHFSQEFKKAERLLEGEVEMPHAVISKNFSEITKLSGILDTPFKSESKKQICIYKSIYREGEYENFVIRTIAVDDDFEQQFYINIFERNNERIIKLDGISNPYRTPAVKFAVLKLAELLKK